MFQKILVPTDGSEYSRRAFQKAVEMAGFLNASIILLHVVYTPEALGYVLTGSATVVQEQLDINGEETVNVTQQNINTNGVFVESRIRSGYPAIEILEEIKAETIDLVIMGNRGYGPIAGSLLGSVSQKVLLKASCPVMIVK